MLSVQILINGTVADANDLNKIHNALLTYLQNIGPTQFANVQLINAIQHGFLGSGVGNYHNNDNIYGSLRPMPPGYHASVPASCTVTIPAGEAPNGLLVFMGARLDLTAKTNVHVPLNFKSGTTAAADLSTVGAPDPRFELELTYTGTMQQKQMWVSNITAATVPVIGGGFVAAKASVVTMGTLYGDGAATDYSLLVLGY